MLVRYGDGKTKFGTGVSIELSGDEVATAIYAWLVANKVHLDGPRTVYINNELCTSGEVYIDPCGFVIKDGNRFNGRGA